MKKIKLYKNQIYSGNLILVNRAHPIQQDFIDGEIQAFQNIFLKKEVVRALDHLLQKINAYKKIFPVDGYRTYKKQKEIYIQSSLENGLDFTKKYVAFPGCSEHQTGLAVDLTNSSKDVDFIRPSFSYEGICKTFRSQMADFGFVERYEYGKDQITGIGHEPWHFRYVGVPHAHLMRRLKMTLEEYIEYLKKFTADGVHKCIKIDHQEFEIFTVGLQNKDEAFVEIPQGCHYELSGNNDDSVIMTLGRDVS